MGFRSCRTVQGPGSVDIVSVGLSHEGGGISHHNPMPSFMSPPAPTTSMLSGNTRGSTEPVRFMFVYF